MATTSLAASPATASDVATQTEVSGKHAAIQALGCRVCLSLLSVSDSSSGGYVCGRCAQVVLSLVAELWMDMSRLRSTRESERKTDWWKHTLPTLRQIHEPAHKKQRFPHPTRQ